MAAKSPRGHRPTDAELEILTVLWSSGAATVRAVHEVLSRRKPVEYTTVLKMLQVMAEKGFVRRDETQRAHTYFASRSAESTRRDLVSDLLQRAFRCSVNQLMLGALSSRRASREELAEI